MKAILTILGMTAIALVWWVYVLMARTQEDCLDNAAWKQAIAIRALNSAPYLRDTYEAKHAAIESAYLHDNMACVK